MSEENKVEEGSFVAFVCAACGQELEAPKTMVGQTVECPACGARLVVASPEQSVAMTDETKSRTIRIELSDL
ncbi:MAG: hypothetical protein ACI4Q3_10020 [Kiritimatiellia bacterium]